MIGLSFSLAMPGAVGGDLIKAYYVMQAASGKRSPAPGAFTVYQFLTLLVGLSGLGAYLSHKHVVQGSLARAPSD